MSMPWTHCVYCGIKLVRGRSRRAAHNRATKDHIYPRSKGGWVLVPCCVWCNSRKGNMPLYRWLLDDRLRERRERVQNRFEHVPSQSALYLQKLYKRGRPNK